MTQMAVVEKIEDFAAKKTAIEAELIVMVEKEFLAKEMYKTAQENCKAKKKELMELMQERRADQAMPLLQEMIRG